MKKEAILQEKREKRESFKRKEETQQTSSISTANSKTTIRGKNSPLVQKDQLAKDKEGWLTMPVNQSYLLTTTSFPSPRRGIRQILCQLSSEGLSKGHRTTPPLLKPTILNWGEDRWDPKRMLLDPYEGKSNLMTTLKSATLSWKQYNSTCCHYNVILLSMYENKARRKENANSSLVFQAKEEKENSISSKGQKHQI